MVDRLSLLPYTWPTASVVAMDKAMRTVREDIGLYDDVVGNMVDIDRIPEQLLDFVGFRWGCIAWPIENFIDDVDELVAYKRHVLRWSFDLRNTAGQIINGMWRSGDIISHELRRVEYTMQLGHVDVEDGVVDESTFVTPVPANTRINAIQIAITPQSARTVSVQELAYLRRVYKAHLPLILYVMPINIIDIPRFDVHAYATIQLYVDREFLII